MNADLIALCEMFLVPATILFAAIGIAKTEPLKTLISALGAGIGFLWLQKIWNWSGAVPLAPNDQLTGLWLAGIFLGASVISFFVHLRRWALGIG